MAVLDLAPPPALAAPPALDRARLAAAARATARRLCWPAATAAAFLAGWEAGRALVIHLAWTVLS